MAEESLAGRCGQIQGFHFGDIDADVQPHILEMVPTDATAQDAGFIETVADPYIVESQSLGSQGNRAAGVIRDFCKPDLEQGIFQPQVLAGKFQGGQRPGEVHVAGQVSAHLAEDGGQERGCIAQVEFIQCQVAFRRLEIRSDEGLRVDVPDAVQLVADHGIETAPVIAPGAADFQVSERYTAQGGFSDGNAGQQVDPLFQRRGQLGVTGSLALDVQSRQERIEGGEVELVQLQVQGICMLGGISTGNDQSLAPVVQGQCTDTDVGTEEIDIVSADGPRIAIKVNTGRKHISPQDQGIPLGPAQFAGEEEFALVGRLRIVVIREAQAYMVVIRQELDAVGLGHHGGDGEFIALQEGIERTIGIVQVQVDALQIFVVQRNPLRCDQSVQDAFPGNGELDVRAVGKIQTRFEVRQDVMRIVGREMQVVPVAGPLLLLTGEESGKFLASRQVLDVLDEFRYEGRADVGSFYEFGIQADAVDVIIDVRGNGNVPDIVVAGFVGQPEVTDVDVPDHVTVLDPAEIGIGAQTDLRGPAFVQMQGVQVRISHIRVELVHGILGFRGQGEDALEKEVEVRVVADDLAVEGIAGIDAVRSDSGIIVTEGVQPVHTEGVQGNGRGASGQGSLDGRLQGNRSDGVDAGNPADIQIPRVQRSAQEDGTFGIRNIAQVQYRIETADAGGKGTIHGEPVDGTDSRSVESELLARSEFVQAEMDLRRPALDEFLQFAQGEGHVVKLVVQQHVLRIGQTDERAVHPCGQTAVEGVEGEILDVEVVDIAVDFGIQGRDKGHLPQGRCEIADRLQIDPAVADIRVETDFFQKMAESLHVRVCHLELLEIQVAEDIPNPQFVNVRLPVADAGDAAHMVHDHAALLAEGKFVGDTFDHLAVHLEFPAFQVDVTHVQVRPVDGVRREDALTVEIAETEAETVDFHPADPQDFLVIRLFGRSRFLGLLLEDTLDVALVVRLVGDDEIAVFDIDFRQVDDSAPEQCHRTDAGCDVTGTGEGVKRCRVRVRRIQVGCLVDDGDISQDDGIEGTDVDLFDGNVRVELVFQHADDLPDGVRLRFGRLEDNQQQ